MLEKFAILAPFALILPLIGADRPVSQDSLQPILNQTKLDQRGGLTPDAANEPPAKVTGGGHALPAHYIVPSFHQVRIEQRVIVRISPRRAGTRQSLFAELPTPTQPPRYIERKIGKCLDVRNIAAVQTGSGNQLLLFTRDQRVISAKLEKACRARDFYSGFYLEQNEDGKLCVERDKLQSRAGANCEIHRIRQLVPAG